MYSVTNTNSRTHALSKYGIRSMIPTFMALNFKSGGPYKPYYSLLLVLQLLKSHKLHDYKIQGVWGQRAAYNYTFDWYNDKLCICRTTIPINVHHCCGMHFLFRGACFNTPELVPMVSLSIQSNSAPREVPRLQGIKYNRFLLH